MEKMVVPALDDNELVGTYELCSHLDATQVEILTRRVEECLDDDGYEEYAHWDDGDETVSFAEMSARAGWWFSEDGCDHTSDCYCGLVTLLEVLSCTEAERRADALSWHMRTMKDLWSHYWSGQAVVESGAGSIGDACFACLVDGHPHLAEIHADASLMAEELGEALAAFSADVSLGAPRWPREIDQPR